MDDLTPRQKRIDAESRWLNSTMILLLLASLSGFLAMLPFKTLSTWLQVNILSHVFIGSILLLAVSFYTFIHFKRTAGMRRPLLLFSGLLTNGLLICLFVSGFWVAYNGHAEAMTWVPNLHSVSAIISIGLIVAHVAFHVLQKKKEKSAETFKTLQKKQYKSFVIVSFSYFFILMLLTGIYQFVEPSTKQNDSELAKLINNYQYNYGAHPFRPSQTETTSGDFVNTNQIATSEQCGTCHTDIYKQWLSSTHRQAASDPAYVKNVSLLETNRGISATRYCEGCHAPIALLTGQLTPGGKHGGIPNTPAHNEGVGCMGCHGIANVVHTNGSASYTYDPKEFYLFDNSKNYFAISLRNFLIRLQPQQHRSAMSPDVLSDPKLCATCHEQFMDESMNDWGWVKMQSEYSNWLKSPFSGQNNQEFQHTANLRCQDCHFPLVDGTDPSADKNNQIRSHRSLGANTILPMLNGDTKQLEMTKKFLQNGKLRLDIEEPDRYDTVFNNQSIEQNRDQRQTDNTPYFLYLGEEAKIRITVTNQMVGHSFPAGTTDLNQAWVNFKVTDIDNRLVYESGAINNDLELDKNAHIYHTIPVDRQGKEVWRHDLFRMTGEKYKNLIESGQSDILEYSFQVPSWAKEPLIISATLKYRKFNLKYAQWVFDTPKPNIPIVNIARDTLTVPLKTKPIVTNNNSLN